MFGKTSEKFGYLLKEKLTKVALSEHSIIVGNNKVFDENTLQNIALKKKIDLAFDFYCQSLKNSLFTLMNSFKDNYFDLILEDVTMDQNFIYLFCFADNDSLEPSLLDVKRTLEIKPCQVKEFSVFFNQWFPNKINAFKMKELLNFLEEQKIPEPSVLTHIDKGKRFYSVALSLNNFIY